jgi:hypothetical protein
VVVDGRGEGVRVIPISHHDLLDLGLGRAALRSRLLALEHVCHLRVTCNDGNFKMSVYGLTTSHICHFNLTTGS